VADLSPVVVAPRADVSLEADYEELGFDVDEGIQWLAREHEGPLYLFTCNPDRFRHQVKLSGLAGWSKAVALQDGAVVREIVLEGGVLADSWERFAAQVYRLER